MHETGATTRRWRRQNAGFVFLLLMLCACDSRTTLGPARTAPSVTGAAPIVRCPAPTVAGAPGRHSSDDLQAVRDEMVAAHGTDPGMPIPNGVQGESVLVMLAPGQEHVADQLIGRYGDVMDIAIGGRRYVPSGCGEATPPDICGPLVGSDPAEAGLRLTFVADTPTIRQSQIGYAHLVVENLGTTRFSMDPGQPILASIVAPATTRVVGHDTFIAGTGLVIDLAPGEERAVKVEFGAGRCDGGDGSAVPPGTYGLRVVLAPQGATEVTRPAHLSPEIPITITP